MSKDAKAALDELCAACCAGARCAGALRTALKCVHDRSAGAAPRLVAGSDLETIWQQRQFRNRAIDRHALAAGRWIARHAAETGAGGETVTRDDANSASAERRAVDEGRLGDAEASGHGPAAEAGAKMGGAGGGAEEHFFSLAAMEAFAGEDEELISASPRRGTKRGDSYGGGEGFGRAAQYADFFDEAEDYGAPPAPAAPRVQGGAAVASLEVANLSGPATWSWHLQGEAGATDRPQNSLLGLDAGWDARAVGAPPPLDVAFGAALETEVRARVLEARFDGVNPAASRAPIPVQPCAGASDDVLGTRAALGFAEGHAGERIAGSGVDPAVRALPRDAALDVLWAQLGVRLDALSRRAAAPKDATPGAGGGGLRSPEEAARKGRRAARRVAKRGRASGTN
mmetsp:Transcript_9157/g.27415  ORF Transcript_9157/g.27415 Transcript_9157/m.27415 type:complete len:400 (-) Transcript_9157:20-1219(-)